MKTVLTGFGIILLAMFYVAHWAAPGASSARSLQPRLTPRARHVPPATAGWEDVMDTGQELLRLAEATPTALGAFAWGYWAWLQTLPGAQAVGLVLLALVLHGLGWLQPVPWVEAKGRKMELKIRIESRQRGLY